MPQVAGSETIIDAINFAVFAQTSKTHGTDYTAVAKNTTSTTFNGMRLKSQQRMNAAIGTRQVL